MILHRPGSQWAHGIFKRCDGQTLTSVSAGPGVAASLARFGR